MINIINNNNVFDKILSVSNFHKRAEFGEVNMLNSIDFNEVASINIDVIEKQVFDIIIRNLSPEMEAYVAGGWVRDKILGRDSKDIDICVWNPNDTLKAAEQLYTNIFGTLPSEERKNTIGTVVGVPIAGLDIDFTPFRQETYVPNSTKPIVFPGNLESETTRRDLTLNSLLYNIKTGMVIDYTRKGIQDLKQGIIDTPLDPIQTFKDDPNRIMRAFRFMAQFGFDMAPRLLETISRPDILDLLDSNKRGSKIEDTKAQVAAPGEANYEQLYKMMIVDNTDDLLKALNAMIETGALSKIIGMDNDKWLPFDTPQRNKHHVNDSIWNHIERVFQGLDENLSSNKEDRFITRMSVLYHDLGKFRTTIRRPVPESKLKNLREKYPDNEAIQWHGFWYTNHPTVSTQLAMESLTDNIKAPSKIRDRIAKLVEMHDVLMDNDNSSKIKKNSFSPSDAYKIVQEISRGGLYPQDVENLITLMIADRKGHLHGDDFSDIEQFKRQIEILGDKLWMKHTEIIDGNIVKDIVNDNNKDKIGIIINKIIYEYLNGHLKMTPAKRAEQIAIENGWARKELMPPKPLINGNWIIQNINPQDKTMIKDLLIRGKELESQGLNEQEIIEQLRKEINNDY